jgi:hypothetical protein
MPYQFLLCASAKLTHRYNTRANQLKRMKHLEQENRELKDEIARLTMLMESAIVALNQLSPSPVTPPPQRTVISEIISSTVLVAAASQPFPAMPARFPWEIPPNFMQKGYVPIFVSLPTSSPVMSVPPPIVHTLSRVEETIYHSEMSKVQMYMRRWMR